MTTIAASLPFLSIAADSRCVFFKNGGENQAHASQCYKLYRTRKYLIGCAGHSDDISEFMRWLKDTSKRRRKITEDFGAVLLSRTALFSVDDNSDIELCRFPFHAIGSGDGYAMAAFSTLHHLGLPLDPEIAVLIACEHDTNTAAPIDVMQWRRHEATETKDGPPTDCP